MGRKREINVEEQGDKEDDEENGDGEEKEKKTKKNLCSILPQWFTPNWSVICKRKCPLRSVTGETASIDSY